jgi:REP element-mobilizing transposase RayT
VNAIRYAQSIDSRCVHGNASLVRTQRSKRPRTRHVQQSLFRRGGKRRGAGRKPKGARAGERHEARPEFKPYHALHVVMRVVPAVGSLRRRRMYKAMRDATICAALREWFRIVHISLQRNHVHLIVEAEDKAALARGMQGFQISAARNVNAALGDGVRRRRGKVFADRYHVVVITTPTQARHLLRYVLCNWRHHGEDQRGLATTWLVDPFSSGISFPDWKELQDKDCMWPIRATYDPLVVRRPATWLLAEGWMRSKCGSCGRKTNLALEDWSGGCMCRGQGRPLDEIFGCHVCRGKTRRSMTAWPASAAASDRR